MKLLRMFGIGADKILANNCCVSTTQSQIGRASCRERV